ncbi:MAG: PKD domain-containing protein [Bacteroidetes bacterium]|nr:PKD domain-containing protein [Bacteroidota bacterium]
MKRLCVCILLFISLPVFSQKEFNNWYFGYYKAITFNSGSPVLMSGSAMEAGGITVSVSDSLGNLRFYSQGQMIWNRFNTMMPNGSGLYGSGGSFQQSVTSVQKLDDDSTYYLFTAGNYAPPSINDPPSYSVIDMRLDSKKGDIVPGYKNIPIPGGQKGWNAVVGTRARNNRDAWIVIRLMDTDSNYFAAYRFTVAGLDPVPVLSPSIVSTPKDASNWYPVTEEIKISPDGTKLYCLYSTDTLEICDFNNQTGVVTPHYTVKPRYNNQIIQGCTSIEFSIDSKLLYLSGIPIVYKVYQYNAELTDSTAFVQSIFLVGSLGNHHSAMQMAPDGKIYGTMDMIDSLWCINSPSVMGTGCGFVRDAFCLLNISHADGLPQFVQRYKAYIHYSGNCGNPLISFTSDIWPPADSISWNFGDASPASNLANPTHMFPTFGTYTVELFVRHNDNRTDTSWQVITIANSLHPNLGADRSICTGSGATFDAGVCSQCVYLWKNLGTGLPVGSGQTFTTNQAGSYVVIVTDPLGCTGSDTVQLFTVNPPLLTNSPLYKSICSGESTNIPLTSNVPGANFHWTVSLTSGNVTGYSADSGLIISQVLLNPISTPGVVTYHITPKTGNCAGDTTDFQVTVNPGDSVKVTITTPNQTICTGTMVTFSASPTNGGTTPAYQWQVNGGGVFPNTPTMSYSPANGDIVKCILTSSNTVCISNNPASSNSITMTVNPNLPVSVAISASANPFCAGAQITFSATPTNGGTNPTYQWLINGTGGSQPAPTYTYTPSNGDIVTCVLTSNITCPTGNPATSNTITMVENTVNPVSIVISTPFTTVCSGTSVTFTATPTNGGTVPIYLWKVNGINAGTNNSTFGYVPVNGDVVSCALTSNLVCASGNPATSNSITMTVNLDQPVSISIGASANPVCAGTQVTFTANPTNGGSNPGYQWFVNGGGVWPNAPAMSYTPANGDQIKCILTSNATCPTGNPATSNTITMVVNQNMPVSVSISASINPVCSGIPVIFTATPTNGGTMPSYQWLVNGMGGWPSALTISYTPANGDQISCILNSNATCATGNPATSITLTMGVATTPVVTFTRCNDSITTINAQPFRLKGGIPLGGTYSGPGVMNGIFYPAIAGVGTRTIIYSFTNVALCSGSASRSLVISNSSSVVCGNTLTDIRDGKVYPTVQIGSQCWMAANLNYGTMIPGNTSQRDNCVTEKYCYNDLTGNCELGTVNYQWDELMTYDETISTQGLCPPGWHVPSEADWNTLFNNFINNAFAAWPLLFTGYSGFNATLTGTRHMNVTWDWLGFATFFWSSTSHGTNKAWSHGLNDTDASVSLYPAFRSNAFSVRCLKDN